MLIRSQRAHYCLIVIAMILAMTLCGAWFTFVKQTLIDLKSGRERAQILMFGLCVTDQIRETTISKLMNVKDDRTAQWRISSWYRPADRCTRCYRHGESGSMLHLAGLISQRVEMPIQEQKQLVGRLMDLLQQEDFRSARILLEAWGRRISPTGPWLDRQTDELEGHDDEASASMN